MIGLVTQSKHKSQKVPVLNETIQQGVIFFVSFFCFSGSKKRGNRFGVCLLFYSFALTLTPAASALKVCQPRFGGISHFLSPSPDGFRILQHAPYSVSAWIAGAVWWFVLFAPQKMARGLKRLEMYSRAVSPHANMCRALKSTSVVSNTNSCWDTESEMWFITSKGVSVRVRVWMLPGGRGRQRAFMASRMRNMKWSTDHSAGLACCVLQHTHTQENHTGNVI